MQCSEYHRSRPKASISGYFIKTQDSNSLYNEIIVHLQSQVAELLKGCAMHSKMKNERSSKQLPLVSRGTEPAKADLCASVLTTDECPTSELLVNEHRWRLAGRQCINSKSTQLRFRVRVAHTPFSDKSLSSHFGHTQLNVRSIHYIWHCHLTKYHLG